MISVPQIKAARGLLEWSQTDLGRRAGLSQTAITNIEMGKVRPTVKSINAIQAACEKEGIEFIEGGVRTRPRGSFSFKGPDFARTFSEFMYQYTAENDLPEICMTGINEAHLSSEDREILRRLVSPLFAKGFSHRIIAKKDMDVPTGDRLSPQGSYRYVPDEFFRDTAPCFIFGPFYAMMLFDAQEVVVIENKNLAESQKCLFNRLWNLSDILPPRT